MTDLLRVLPDFPVERYAHLIQALEKHSLTTTDLLTLDAADIGKQTQLPLLDIKRFSDAVLHNLHIDLGVAKKPAAGSVPGTTTTATIAAEPRYNAPALQSTLADLTRDRQHLISTLDDGLDRALGGGIPTGHVTEITGESGAGKTQFLLALLLAVQLPPPHGLGRPALYISTEAALSTKRLSQMLSSHPLLSSLSRQDRPSMDGIMSTVTPDLESQEHILQFQAPVEIERRNVGLLIIDSVAANYRAEFERDGTGTGTGTGTGGRSLPKSRGSNMAARSNELVRLGAHLRHLAQKYNLAVVVANQVADRFSSSSSLPGSSRAQPPRSSGFVGLTQESPLATRSKGPPPPTPEGLEPTSSMMEHLRPEPMAPPFGPHDGGSHNLAALALDHQQRWFTGWGDDPFAEYGLKTPSLGLVWSTQISSRIALLKKPVYGVHRYANIREPVSGSDRYNDDYDDGESQLPTLRSWRRWMKVVFAPHAESSGQGLDDAVEFEVHMGGLRSLDGRDENKDDG